MAVLGYLPIYERSLGLAFGAHFQILLQILLQRLLQILNLWTKFQCHIFFPSEDYLDHLCPHKL